MSSGTVTPSSMATSKYKKCCWCDKLVYGAVLFHGLTAAAIHRHCAAQLGMHALIMRDIGDAEPPPLIRIIERPAIEWDVTPEGNEHKQLDMFARGDN